MDSFMYNLLTLVWIEEQVVLLIVLTEKNDTHALRIIIMILTQELESLSEIQLIEWQSMALKQETKHTEEDSTTM